MLATWENTFAPDESYFYNVLLQSPFAQSKNSKIMRYIKFVAGQAHPSYLTSANFENITTSGACFARKLSYAVDMEILMC